MDLYRITHPLRLARGSHQPASGKGCAMNVISYFTGDEQVTDWPTRSARPLSLLVQTSNDLLAGPDGYLLPDDSVLAPDIAALHRAAASGDMPAVADWDTAGRAAREVASTLSGAGMRAAQAAAESTAFVDNDLLISLDKVAG
jgi:hypothetical protein